MMGLWSGQAAQIPAAGMAARLAPPTPKPEVLRAAGVDSSGWSLQGSGVHAPHLAPPSSPEPSAWLVVDALSSGTPAAPAASAAASSAPLGWRVVLASGSVLLGAVAGGARKQRRGGRGGGSSRRAQVVLRAVETAAPPAVDKAAKSKRKEEAVEAEAEVELPGRPLQIVKIDLESNCVVLGEEELQELEDSLRKTGAQKVAVVGVMGAFRTGKSFLLDLMLRYLQPEKQGPQGAEEECEVPDWVQKNSVPEWAVRCGTSVVEGREGGKDTEGFIWRPGMEKCTEGVWIWSKAFVRQAGDEKVAVVLMDTQGAWDAKMTKEQSATVFGLTTLMTSRLVYNVSKQIQQDKIDNLLYFTDFAKAALRTKEKSIAFVGEGTSAKDAGSYRPFQTLEFLVRDWPHYPDEVTVDSGRTMMLDHLKQYFDPKRVEDTKSIDALKEVFEGIDCWCLPHPSLAIERESWSGDLSVVEPNFWRFVDAYMSRIFSPEELRVKATLGTPLTVDTFSTVIREFIMSFRNAAPQAKTFSEAMETSTSLMARDVALKLLKKKMDEVTANDQGIEPARFDKVAAEAAVEVEKEFSTRAIFGSEEGIKKVSNELQQDVKDELERYREENGRRLEASLVGLTNISLAAVAAFGIDRVSDLTCDWWSPFCQEVSQDLSVGYFGVTAYVAYSLFNINEKQGGMDATVAAIELAKSMVKRAKKIQRELSEKSD